MAQNKNRTKGPRKEKNKMVFPTVAVRSKFQQITKAPLHSSNLDQTKQPKPYCIVNWGLQNSRPVQRAMQY